MRGGYFEINRKVNFAEPVIFSSAFSNPFVVTRFVDGLNGDDLKTGKTPDTAVKTIQRAVTLSARGDIIFIRPQDYVIGTGFRRYTEDVLTALAQSDLSIIGVTPSMNPEYGVRWKHATAQCLTNFAPALHLENIGFFAEGATYGILLSNNGVTDTQRGSDGTTIYNCVIKGKGLYVLSGGDGVCIERTRFHCAYDGTVAQLNYSCSVNPGRRLLVRNCEWQDGNGVVSSGPCIEIAPPLTEILIRDCYFPQLPTGGCYISAAGASNEGLIANCHFAVADMTLATAILKGGIFATGIYDETGLVTA